MIEHEPFVVQSRGRLYTDRRLRSKIGVSDMPYGRGTEVAVGVVSVDRSPAWGTYSQSGTFSTELGYYGEITIPADVRNALDVDVGDGVRVSVRRI